MLQIQAADEEVAVEEDAELATLYLLYDLLQSHLLHRHLQLTPLVQTRQAQKVPTLGTRIQDVGGVAYEEEEEEPEVAERLRTGPSMEEPLVDNSHPTTNCKETPPPSFLDSPSSPKALHRSRPNPDPRDAAYQNPQHPTLPLVLTTTLTTATTNAPSAQAKCFVTPKYGHAIHAGLFST